MALRSNKKTKLGIGSEQWFGALIPTKSFIEVGIIPKTRPPVRKYRGFKKTTDAIQL